MKREDAIKLLIPMRVVDGERSVAIDMAIEALREMSVEEYRQRLMELFHITDHDELITFVVMPKEKEFKSLEYILRQYKYEPRPHGKWVFKYDNPLIKMGYWECSKCKTGRLLVEENFCPNCGADMRKEGEQE